jgi:CubicO group peptidase (beta-lactamase class C family)
MTTMMRRQFLATAALGGSAAFMKSAHVLAAGAVARTSVARLHTLMKGYVTRKEVPGMVTLISRGGDVQVDTVGKRAVDGERMTRDTIFRIASMTKPITAAATMILVEDGKLKLDDPVDRLLPELAHPKVLRKLESQIDDTVPAKRAITVGDLLTFRMGTGLILAAPDTYPIQRAQKEKGLVIPTWPQTTQLTPDQWIERLGSLPLLHQPGEGWMYNTGSEVLGVLISRVAKQPFGDFLNERIFAPLGMKDTSFTLPAAKIPRAAACYSFDHQKKALTLFDAPAGQWSRPPSFPSGGAGLLSTVDDYLAFAQMMMNKGTDGKNRILSEVSVKEMTTNHLTPEQMAMGSAILGPSGGWGLGLSVVAKPDRYTSVPGRYGWNGGLGTMWWSDPSRGLVAILLTQRMFESADPPPVCVDFLSAAYQAAAET